MRDAQGNVMAVYTYKGSSPTDGTLYLSEQHLYGSSRLGVWNRSLNMDAAAAGGTAPLLGATQTAGFERGRKQYELSNHLGNVLVTVSDKKTGVDENSDGTADYYTADVTTAQDYYPFGMLMPSRKGHSVSGGWATSGGNENGVPSSLELKGRSGNQPGEYRATQSIEFISGFTSGEGDSFETFITEESGSTGGSGSTGTGDVAGGYRYGFNGKENDDDVKGEGDEQDYGMRIYDPRIGRFLSVDPLTKSYPYYTPYQFSGNKPIACIDVDGLEEVWKVSTDFRIQYQPVIKTPNVLTATNNAAHNATSFLWNVSAGAVLEGSKKVYNTTVETVTGNYKPAAWESNPVQAAMDWLNDQWDYFTQTPAKQQAKDFANAATDLRNYEAPAQIIIAHELPLSELPIQNVKIKLSAELPPGTKVNGLSFSRGTPSLTKKVNDFVLGHSEEAILKSNDYKNIRALSDEQLINSVTKPKKYDPVTINTATGGVSDGNTRLYELRRRKLNIDVPYKNYSPDRSMFNDPKEPPKKM